MPTSVQTHEIVYPFHRWQGYFHACASRERCLLAGIRGGKTVAGSNEFLRMVTEGPPNVSILTGPDKPVINQTTLETIFHGMGPKHLGKWPRELIEPAPGGGLIDGKGVIQLKTGDRVLVRTGDKPDNLRGPAAKAWWIDEITLCRPDILSILQGRTLDTGGRGICTGTPKGKEWFARQVLFGLSEVIPGRVWSGPRWTVIRYPTSENPGVNIRDIADLGRHYSEKLRRQELDAEIVDWGGAVFSSDSITNCLTLPACWHFGYPTDGHPVAFGLDPSGAGQDETVLYALCLACRAICDLWVVSHHSSFAHKYQGTASMAGKWKPEVIVFDATGLGAPMVEEVADAVAKVSPGTVIEAFYFGAKSKSELLNNAIARVEEGVSIPATEHATLQPLVAQVRGYEWDDKELRTDHVMAFALALRALAPAVSDAAGHHVVEASHLRDEAYTPMDHGALVGL